ncbi:MAG: flavin reductase [Oscillospiraceae bacterium]|jgi:flavin reductase (DIM6/NTAB) family NADH-FMN oxidoreductase RutF|nr:flavin reductase [Oscillospiraceae bacterium]
MSVEFEKINARELQENFIKSIAEHWALLCAGAPDHWNGMTVSWGGFGELWGFDAAFVFVRPQRHTFGLLEQGEAFTLSFGLPREALQLCGKSSGRDGDKMTKAGLHPAAADGMVWPQEAEWVLLCRKAAAQDLDPATFCKPGLAAAHYPGEDYHRMYIGEIVMAKRRKIT